ncbi:putative oxidoreductase [Streptomyces indicus]|uniref:Putative oxidoreductase n=1 Tax=Streptomyces indicus TaxID=417292 RepID=A0A1G9HNU5_9ACTN|nr:putative oxidoreductase [Streptomyces indicus]
MVGAARSITTELKASGAHTVAVDLSTSDGARHLVNTALNKLGHLDLVVNNVGGGEHVAMGGFLDTDDNGWQRTIDLNLFAAVRVTRYALPSLLERRGVVVNVSSIGARMPATGPIEYNAAKAALTSFTTSLSEEFGPRGLRANTVSPGPVRTAIWEDSDGFGAALAAASDTDLTDFLPQVPAAMGMVSDRLTEPEEVAALIAFLASEHAYSIRGADYLVDGGMDKTA